MSVAEDEPAALDVKKTRRQTAFYPNINATNKPPKPFSRSAAKRESVLALGSIEHLQHYFTKSGIAAKQRGQNGLGKGKAYVPALGPLLVATSAEEDPSDLPVLPQTPLAPPMSHQLFPHDHGLVSYMVDPEALKPEAIADLEEVEQAWGIHTLTTPTGGGDASTSAESDLSEINLDVLGVLKTTTRTIRNVRNYYVSLPHDHPSHHLRPEATKLLSRTLASGAPGSSTATARPQRETDPLAVIRRSALEVLTVLRSLEESARLSLAEDASDSLSTGSGSAPATSDSRSHTPAGTRSEGVASPIPQGDEPSTTRSKLGVVPLNIRGRLTPVPVWSDDESEEEDYGTVSGEKETRWDDRLVLGGGWLYKADIKVSNLSKEREVIGNYLDIVDELLFEGSKNSETRGWTRAKEEVSRVGSPKKVRQSFGGTPSSPRFGSGRRAVSSSILQPMGGMEVMSEEPEEVDALQEADEDSEADEEGIPDSELPEWAQREFSQNTSVRLHSLLSFHLVPDLKALLPSHPDSPDESFRLDLLTRLSDGQLLCISYNSIVRRSKKPWGFIQPASIHDIVALEKEKQADKEDNDKKNKGTKSWTFRRTENLRMWAAALKLRYLIPLGAPATAHSLNIAVVPSFDPRVVAKKEGGWDAMLEQAINLWVTEICKEKRGLGF